MNIDLAQFEEIDKINALISPEMEYQIATGRVLIIVFSFEIVEPMRRVDVMYKAGGWYLRPVIRAQYRDYFSVWEMGGMLELISAAMRVADWLNQRLTEDN